MPRCLLGLGSNLGDSPETVRSAAERLGESEGIKLVDLSSLHQTQPIGGPQGQQVFTNAAAVIETTLAPLALVDQLQAVEAASGRQRRTRWESRTLDIDLLLYEDQVISSDRLVTPHPRMSFRPFVLTPATEIAQDMLHPLLDQSIGELWDRLQSGEQWVSVTHGEESFQQVVLEEVRMLSPNLTARKRPLEPGSPKLTVCLAAPIPLPDAGPTLWLPAELSEETRRQELSAALACVWPGLG